MTYAPNVGVTDGGDTFLVPWPALQRLNVSFTLDGEVLDPSEYTWLTPGEIKLNTVPASGLDWSITRETPVDEPVVVFGPGNLTSTNLNDAHKQHLYYAQERKFQGDDTAARALMVPSGETILNLPNVAGRASSALGFNSLGQPVALPLDPVSIGVPGPETVDDVHMVAGGVRERALKTNMVTMSFASRALMAAFTPRTQSAAIMYGEAGRRGEFVWQSGDLSAYVTNDPGQGVYVPPASAPSGASGAWVRLRQYRFYDVEWFGASTGSTDNTQAVQRAINLAKYEGGGKVCCQNYYQIGSMVTVDGNDIEFEGSCQSSGLFRTTAGIVIKFTGSRHSVRNCLFVNAVYTITATDYVVWVNDAVALDMERVRIIGGYHCLAITGGGCADNNFTKLTLSFAMGHAMVYVADATGGVNGAHHFYRCTFNQAYPVSDPNGTSTFKGARLNGTAYAVGDIVATGNFYLQCRVAGTSGGSAPSVGVWYYVDIADGGGTLKWQLVGRTDYCGMDISTNTYYSVVRECDFTGPYQFAVQFRNHFSGNAPRDWLISRCTLHGPVSIGVYVAAGNQILLENLDIWRGADNTATTYGILQTGGNDVRVRNCGVYQMDVGIAVNAAGTYIDGGAVVGCGTGISVANGVASWAIRGVALGGNIHWGSNSVGVAVGTGCDYYNISNNVWVGATTPLSNGSAAAANKSINGNI